VSAQASGDTAVLTYPNVQQVFTKTTDTDPAISAFTAITSAFTETMNPQAGTDAEAAYDLWASRGGEVIFSLNKSERSGTVDILGVLTWLRGRGRAAGWPALVRSSGRWTSGSRSALPAASRRSSPYPGTP
jgi:hypothetical protein